MSVVPLQGKCWGAGGRPSGCTGASGGEGSEGKARCRGTSIVRSRAPRKDPTEGLVLIWAVASLLDMFPPRIPDRPNLLGGYRGYAKTPDPLGPPQDPRHRPTVGSLGGAFSCR